MSAMLHHEIWKYYQRLSEAHSRQYRVSQCVKATSRAEDQVREAFPWPMLCLSASECLRPTLMTKLVMVVRKARAQKWPGGKVVGSTHPIHGSGREILAPVGMLLTLPMRLISFLQSP